MSKQTFMITNKHQLKNTEFLKDVKTHKSVQSLSTAT